jgi:hypothetical protein
VAAFGAGTWPKTILFCPLPARVKIIRKALSTVDVFLPNRRTSEILNYGPVTGITRNRKIRFELLRDLKAIEKQKGRKLSHPELTLTCKEWHRLSQPFLDPQKTFDDYFARFLSERRKVRFAIGEGAITNALQNVSKLSDCDLPVIASYPNAPESWHRILALHGELSRSSGGRTYFLTCRDAAKAFPGLSHQMAYYINGALAELGAIEIVRVGDARPNGGKASEFRYLLSQTENVADEADRGFDL